MFVFNKTEATMLAWDFYWIVYFIFMGTNFRGLLAKDIFVDTFIRGFQIIRNITKVNIYFVGILNSCIGLPTKYIKLNVQRIKMISQYYNCL